MLLIFLTYVTCFVRLILLHSITWNLKLSLSSLLHCYFPFALFLLSLEVAGFSRSIVDVSAVRGCCAAQVGSWLPMIGTTSVPSWRLTLEDGTDILSRNVSYQLPTYAEQRSRKVKTTSSLFSRKRWYNILFTPKILFPHSVNKFSNLKVDRFELYICLKSGIFSSVKRNDNYTRRFALGWRDEALCAFCLSLRLAIRLEEKWLQPAASVAALWGKSG